MYITDLTHFLDGSGAIAPIKGPARAMAQFVVEVVAHATDESDTSPAAPTCFKCKKGPVTALRGRFVFVVKSDGRRSSTGVGVV